MASVSLSSTIKSGSNPNFNSENFRESNIQESHSKFLFWNLKKSTINEAKIMLLVLGVIISGGLNRVASKISTVPMEQYSFFLGLWNSLVYVVFYFIILGTRYCMGIVTKQDLLYCWTYEYQGKSIWDKISPWKYFVIMGFMDGLGNILGLIATPYLDGALISLLSQTIVPFSVICAIVILGTRYSFWQIWSVLFLLCGVMLTLMPDFNHSSQSNNLGMALVMAFSTLPNAISFTVKEFLFSSKKDLDVFIVNSHGSLFQLILQPIFLPLTIILDQNHGENILDFVRDSFYCFTARTPKGAQNDCSINPFPWLIYISINIIFNILLLIVTKRASALLSFMAIKAILPLSVILFSLSFWPYLKPSPISVWDWTGLFVILLALVLYRFMTMQKNTHHLECMSLDLPFLSPYFFQEH